MTTPKDKKPAPAEEIEWTDEDDAIINKVWAELRKKGVKADPVHPVKSTARKPSRATNRH